MMIILRKKIAEFIFSIYESTLLVTDSKVLFKWMA